eukprot:gnl/MRDRNA2_/MRDRNA2_30099_c0_seq1.p1 gnl/MRDRNA2_/MRDRNA2_30099_c0~~gnl/MRDRNA2_/MRDRNA2_30099_c0_seq1.p1  ORF type:complete len:294 (+),score=35.31 gnl/MRDRNA2_/MRDRNA2_30099_c0_seq1:83-964(+)
MLARHGSFCGIHAGIRAEHNRNASRVGLGRRNSVSSTSLAAVKSDSIRPLDGSAEKYDSWEQEVRFGRLSLPVWEGMLKQKKSKLFGLGTDVWRDRWVRLDPEAGAISIWSVRDDQLVSECASGPAKKVYDLGCIRGVDSNRHHRDIMILLSNSSEQDKVKYALQFRAGTIEDYNKWMFVLGHFGMRHDILGVDPKLRGQLTRAFSVMTLDTDVHQDITHDSIPEESFTCCNADTESCQSTSSTVLSQSTNCSVQTLDDDTFRQLSVMLEDVSPCNARWCDSVGLPVTVTSSL